MRQIEQESFPKQQQIAGVPQFHFFLSHISCQAPQNVEVNVKSSQNFQEEPVLGDDVPDVGEIMTMLFAPFPSLTNMFIC